MLVKEAVERFIRVCEIRNRSVKTIKWRCSVLNALCAWQLDSQVLGDRPLEYVDFDLLSEYILHLRRRRQLWAGHPYKPARDGQLSETTVQGHIKVIKTFFNWLEKRRVLDENPMRDIPCSLPRPDTPRGLSKEKVRAFINAATEKGAREKAIALFFLDTGSRLGECASATTNKLDLSAGVAIVLAKGGHFRPVFFIERTANALMEWLDSPERKVFAQKYSDEAHYVFLGRSGALTCAGIYGIIRALGEPAGIKKLAPHQLRHTFTYLMLEHGASLAVVSDLLDHKSIKTTADIYGLFDTESLKRQHDKWSPVLCLGDGK